jgi:hypothetical protein
MILILTEVWWIFIQGELIFLFNISISLHNLRIVSGFFLLNNYDSFNAFDLLKQYFGIRFFFFHLQSLDTVIRNEIRHQSLEIDITYIMWKETIGCRPGTEVYNVRHQEVCWKSFFFQSGFTIVFSKTENYFVVFYNIKHSSFKHIKVVSG